MTSKAHELDDGSPEAVERHPRRRLPKTLSITETVNSPVGGKITRRRSESAQQGQDFVMMRSQLGAAKVMLGHLEVFSTLWRLWAAKRVQNAAAGVSVSEIADATKLTVHKVGAVLATLIRNGIVRSIRTNVGWANVRAAYSPTEIGTQILALAEALGPGSSIQVGGRAAAWKSRTDDEPGNVFKHAAMLRNTTQRET